MHKLDRTVAGIDRIFHVYTREEALEEGISPRDWRMARTGQWVLSDDGYVFECCKVQRYPKPEKNRISFFFTFSCCRKWLTRRQDSGKVVGNPELEVAEFLEEEAYYMTSPQDWIDQELTTKRAKRAISMWATLFIANEGHLTEEEWKLIGQAYRPTQTNPSATAKSLFKKEKTRDMANAKVTELLEKAGVTRQSVVEHMEELREQAAADGKYNTAYRVLEKQLEMLGMDEDFPPARGDGAPRQIEEKEVKLLGEMEEDLDEKEEVPESATSQPAE